MTLPTRSLSPRQGFTLVELLVVITVIAVLAGIALPVFSRVQERAKALECANNLKNLALGAVAFMTDNDGDILVNDKDEPWPIILRNGSVNVNKVYQSPFDKRERNDNVNSTDAPLSYGINAVLNSEPRNIEDVKYPSKLILFAPAAVAGGKFEGDIGDDKEVSNTSNPDVSGGKNNGGTHGGGKRIKAAFLDGHVSDLSMIEFRDASSTGDGDARWQWLSVKDD